MAELEDGTYMIRNGQLYKIELPESFFKVKGAKTVKIPKFEVIPISKPSNADRIRAMTDDEMASAIRNPCDFSTHIPSEWCRSRRCGFQCTLDWLKKECDS